MNLEKLSKPELLTLLSILEGELEARELVIEAIKAQHKDRFIEERYGKYNISDPLLALQRDYEILKEDNHGQKPPPVCSNPLFILSEVMKQCKTMQERMLAQLAAAESRHRKVILDLEEERRRHAQDAADGDDVTYMLEKERERLAQQLDFEKSQVKKLEKKQKELSAQLEDEKARHKKLSTVLLKECTKANNRAAEEGQRVEDVNIKLEKARTKVSQLEEELALEKKRSLQMEAQVEKQLSEFDIEREQLRAKLNREENRTKALKEELESLKKFIKDMSADDKDTSAKSNKEMASSVMVSAEKPEVSSVSCQTENVQEKISTDALPKAHISLSTPSKIPQPYSKINGHCGATTQSNEHALKLNVGEGHKEKVANYDSSSENGGSPVRVESPLHMITHVPSSGASSSPSSTAASSLTSSPCSSPVLSRRLIGATGSPGYQSPYQAGINQRFHAARHKFQSQAEHDQHVSGLQSPPSRDLSPTLADNSAAKQLARNTVTQVLSRFTSQQTSGKSVPPNSSPFGTDYRNLANSSSQKNDGSLSPNPLKVSSPLSPVSPGIKSPTISRVERGNPPPIPPKKPGLAQSPASPIPPAKAPTIPSSLAASVDVSSNHCSNNGIITNGKDIEVMLPSGS
ncbi:CTTNBP2 N-terminal-like protein [Hyla sarda]|uniref:CTTNBP2 N-terminal-like protein n=1 Tax=Hyla sarda TaxID=327740 RepID=UPI0024C306CE|nr:CTTNBP2 N-terminal-like protein [Hyla sarda]XP_056414258.1 CTTNBP2 N-terminal-like protein [Hyla sarda]